MRRHEIGENKVGESGRNDDRNGSGEPFQNVVRILHHKRYEQTAESLDQNDWPGDGVVSLEKSAHHYCVAVLKKDGQQWKRAGKQTKLQISNPKRLLTEFDQLFKVNAGKAGRKAWKQHSSQSDQTRPALTRYVGLLWGCVHFKVVRPLYKRDTDHEQKKRNPLFSTQLSSEHQHGKQSGGQDFELISNLEKGKNSQLIDWLMEFFFDRTW